MKKILLLGDSFVDDRNIWGRSKMIKTKTYQKQLEELYSVTNLSLWGSNLAFTYQQYIKHHKEFDLIIIMVTKPGKLELPKHSRFLNGKTFKKWRMLPNIKTIQHMKNDPEYKNEFQQKILNAAENYFSYIENYEHVLLYHKCMVQQMIASNTLLIPCFEDSVLENTIYCLANLSKKELGQRTYPDVRPCHLNQENHNKFAKELISWIETKEFNLSKLF